MNTAAEIAQLLLEIQAITLNIAHPYRFTSGILSPIYCDNRLIISYPEKRKIVIDAFLHLIEELRLEFDTVAGIATAGIPHAAWIADRLNKPMVYIRSQSKSHGKRNQIEGQIQPHSRALVIEDLISTGNSALSGVMALRENKVTVTDCLAVFSYQFPTALLQFNHHHLSLHTLSNFTTLIEVAERLGKIQPHEKSLAMTWNQDPHHWTPPTGM